MNTSYDYISDEGYRRLAEEYLSQIKAEFAERLKGVLLYGSVAKGTNKPYGDYCSDLDLIVIIDGLSDNLRERLKEKQDLEENQMISSIWMTPKEFGEQCNSKPGYLLDALDEGKILYDPLGLIEGAGTRVQHELQQRGVKKTKYGWIFPGKLGEVVGFG